MTSRIDLNHASGLLFNRGTQTEHKIYSFVDAKLVLCLAIVLYGLGAWLSQNRAFDQDEFFHLQAAWNVYNGWLPYRDFFEHHAPLYYFLLAPVFYLFRVDTDPNSAISAMFFVRGIMWIVSGIVLIETFWLGRLWRNSAVGVVAVFFLVSTEAFWSKGLEIRPDTLAVAFFLYSLIGLVHAMHQGPDDTRRSRTFGWSGVVLGIAFLMSQKAAYALPGFLIGTCWYMCSGAGPIVRQCRLGHIIWVAVGFWLPLLLTAAYFYANGALDAAIHYNFFFNLGLMGFSPWPNFQAVAYQNPYLIICGGAGWILYMFSFYKGESQCRGAHLLLPTTGVLVLGLFHIPVPYHQYYLWFLPLVALCAAALIVEVTLRLIVTHGQRQEQWTLVASFVGLTLLMSLVLIGRGANSHWPAHLVIGYWFTAFLGLIALLYFRLPSIAVPIFFLALVLPPLIRITASLRSVVLRPQLEEIRYVVESTVPTDRVLDGYTGTGIFRPAAYFYGLLPWNVRQSLNDKVKRGLLNDLRTGAISPVLIFLDHNLEQFSPAIRDFVEQRYEPTGVGFIWRRTPDASTYVPSSSLMPETPTARFELMSKQP